MSFIQRLPSGKEFNGFDNYEEWLAWLKIDKNNLLGQYATLEEVIEGCPELFAGIDTSSVTALQVFLKENATKGESGKIQVQSLQESIAGTVFSTLRKRVMEEFTETGQQKIALAYMHKGLFIQ